MSDTEIKHCPHVTLVRQNVGNFHWHKCVGCETKFKAIEWDGKVTVIPAATPQVTPTDCTHLLMNLLAVIHRDGGHYVADHALLKACEDAEAIVIKLLHAVEGTSEPASPTPEVNLDPSTQAFWTNPWHSSPGTTKGTK